MPESSSENYIRLHKIYAALEEAADVKDIANLYYINAELVEANPELKARFTTRKNEFYNGSNLVA